MRPGRKIVHDWGVKNSSSPKRGYSTVVVRRLAKAKVVGPNPIARSYSETVIYSCPLETDCSFGNG